MNEVSHDPQAMKFFLMNDGKESHLFYRKKGRDLLDFIHTYVPPEHRGRAIAGQIVRTARDYAAAEGYRVIPTCPFVRDFMEIHPEYEKLRSE